MQCAVWGAVPRKCAVVEKRLGSTGLASSNSLSTENKLSSKLLVSHLLSIVLQDSLQPTFLMVGRLLEFKAMQSLFSPNQLGKKLKLLMLLMRLNKKYLLVNKLCRRYNL